MTNLLEIVSDGVIWLDDVDVTDPRTDAVAVRRRIGTVFQAYNLFPHMSVLDNVALAPRKVQRVPAAEARTRAMELLDRVGLADKANDFPDVCPAGRRSGPRSREPWPTGPACCCSTRSRAPAIPSWWAKS